MKWNAKEAGINIVSTNDDDAIDNRNQFRPEGGVSRQDDGEPTGGNDGINVSSAYLVARPTVLVTGNVSGNANPWSGGMCHM
jgi:hypothetical protein